jgi:hypothetical protein
VTKQLGCLKGHRAVIMPKNKRCIGTVQSGILKSAWQEILTSIQRFRLITSDIL